METTRMPRDHGPQTSLRWQLSLALLVMTGLALIGGGEILRSYESSYLLSAAKVEKQNLIELTAAVLHHHTPQSMSGALQPLISREPELLHLQISDPQGQELFAWDSKIAQTAVTRIAVAAPVSLHNKNAGTIKASWNLSSRVEAIQNHVMILRIILGGFLLTLTLVVLWCLDVLVICPLESIGNRMRQPIGNAATAPPSTALSREFTELETIVTERLRSEAALRFSRYYLDHAGDATFWIDRAGILAYTNLAATTLTQASATPLHGKQIAEIFPELVSPSWDDFWCELERVPRRTQDTICQQVAGTSIPVELCITLLQFEGSEYCCLFARDIRERIRVQEELRRASALAEAASAAKGNFLANMSHEIRTPMNGILGMTGFLCETPLSDEQREFLNIIQASAESLLTIINDILDFSKVEAGKIRIDPIEFSVREVLSRTIMLVAPLAKSKGLDLTLEIDPSVPEKFFQDQGRIQQILTNLLSNATKFTAHGQITVAVTARPFDDGRYQLRVQVTDTGVGIPADRLDAIFEPFEQADSSTTRRFGGTGLGLSISRSLCRLMAGELSVSSDLGRGSTFSFEIATPTPYQPTAWPLLDYSILEGRRVILVDDRLVVTRPIIKGLQFLRLQVTTIPSMECAKDPNSDAFYFIVRDLGGDKDGLRTVESLRAKGVPPDHIAIFLHANENTAIKDSVRDLGIFEIFRQPVAINDVLGACLRMAGLVELPRRYSQAILLAPFKSGPQPLSILVAEDNRINQLIIERILSKLGHEVVVVENGALALEALDHKQFDLIFLDVQMPVLDGISTVRQIRDRTDGAEKLPVIALTAHALEEERIRCFEAGMNEHLTKPIERPKLELAIRRFTGRADG